MLEDHSPSLTFLSDEKDDEFLRRGEGSLPNIQRNHNFATAELWQRIPTNKYSTYIYIYTYVIIYIYIYIYLYTILICMYILSSRNLPHLSLLLIGQFGLDIAMMDE